MDLSKLPRLSQTDRPPGDSQAASADAPSNQTPNHNAQPPMVVGAEAWISIVMGIILILFFPRIWQYFISPGSFTWTFADKQGAPLTYPKSAFFPVDLGLAAFAVVLILDGIVLMLPRFKTLLMLTLGVTVLSTVFNLIAMIWVMREIGVQLIPILAIALGVYIALYQWHRLRPALQ